MSETRSEPRATPETPPVPVKLLLRLSLRYLQRHPAQVLLALVGVAIGVAMLVAVELATQSARQAFTLSSQTLAGSATHQVEGGPAGLDASLLSDLREAAPNVRLAPVLEAPARALDHPGERFTLLGLDPEAERAFRPTLDARSGGQIRLDGRLFGQEGILTLTEGVSSCVPQSSDPAGAIPTTSAATLCLPPVFPPAGTLLMEESTATRLGLGPGQTLRLHLGAVVKTVLLAGTYLPGDPALRSAYGPVLLAHQTSVMAWLDAPGLLTRIEAIVTGPEDEALLRQALPADAHLTTPRARQQSLSQLTVAFETNLRALSFLALIVGLFLIYNTMTFSVVSRRPLLGMLRCLGLTRRELFAQVLLEALALALPGSLLGVGLGVVLGRGLIHLVSQTLNDLYFAVSVTSLELDGRVLGLGFTLGVLATVGTAILPALEATTTAPRLVQRRSTEAERMNRLLPVSTLTGLALLLACLGGLWGLSQPGLARTLPLEASFLPLLALILGAASLTPLVTVGLMKLLRPLTGALLGTPGRMAPRDVVASLSRTSVAIAALMVSVAVTLGIGLMVESFRLTVEQWLKQSLIADVYISIPGATSIRSEAPLPKELESLLRARPEVARVRTHRRTQLQTEHGPLELIGAELLIETDRAAYTFLDGTPKDAWSRYEKGGLLITEPLAHRLGLHAGMQLTLPTAAGPTPFPIAGVYRDYASDQGLITLKQEVLMDAWKLQGVTSMALEVRAGQDVEALVQTLRALPPPELGVEIRSSRTLRESSMQVFDRTFAITEVLQLLAAWVAFVGILSALMSLALERARELAVLRALGLTPAQLWGLILGQTGLMGLTSGLLALPTGVAITWMLIDVVNLRSFGWSMPMSLDLRQVLLAVPAATLAALVAGLYPAWKMSRTSPGLALREE